MTVTRCERVKLRLSGRAVVLVSQMVVGQSRPAVRVGGAQAIIETAKNCLTTATVLSLFFRQATIRFMRETQQAFAFGGKI